MSAHSAKPYQPSSARLALAAQRGLLRQSPLLFLGVLLILSGFLCLALIPKAPLFDLALKTLAQPRANLPNFLQDQIIFVLHYTLVVAIPAGCLLGAATILARRQKRGGQSNVPIPTPFPPYKHDMYINGLTFLTAVLVTVAVFRNGGFTYTELEHAPLAVAIRLVRCFLWSCISNGVIAVLGGLVQLSQRRTQLLRHLSLDGPEQEKELRLQGQTRLKRHMGQW